jgi:hypothetical protein
MRRHDNSSNIEEDQSTGEPDLAPHGGMRPPARA